MWRYSMMVQKYVKLLTTCPPVPTLPESIDMKITNYCDEGCPMCHENSSPAGKHADLDAALEYLKGLNPGTEIAIGGGDAVGGFPVDSNQPEPFIISLVNDLYLIPNITIHESLIHDTDYFLKWITDGIDEGWLYGVGVSGTTPLPQEIYEKYPTIVHHVIAGYHEIEDIEHLHKVLVLGYKMKGRGLSYVKTNDIEAEMYRWYTRIPLYFDKVQMSFDNLAIEQLKMCRFFKDDKWK